MYRKEDPDWQMYRVGDELEVIADYSSHGFPIGSTATIVRVDHEDGWYYYRAIGLFIPYSPRGAAQKVPAAKQAERWVTHGDLADPITEAEVQTAIESIRRAM